MPAAHSFLLLPCLCQLATAARPARREGLLEGQIIASGKIIKGQKAAETINKSTAETVRRREKGPHDRAPVERVDVSPETESEGLWPKIFVGIKSGVGPEETERRRKWRDSPCRQYYADNHVGYKFFIGRPYESGHSLTGHNQGGQDTPWEQLEGTKLLQESEESNDIVMMPMRDQYMSLPDKTFGIFDYAVTHFPDVQYLGEQDVEYCMDAGIVRRMITAWEGRGVRQKERETPCSVSGLSANCAVLYLGAYMWKGTEYAIMTGPTGQHAPYMSGWFYLMSRTLAEVIVGPERARSVLNGVYGTASEDLDVGLWVSNASEVRNLNVSYVSTGMIKEVGQIHQPTLLR